MVESLNDDLVYIMAAQLYFYLLLPDFSCFLFYVLFTGTQTFIVHACIKPKGQFL